VFNVKEGQNSNFRELVSKVAACLNSSANMEKQASQMSKDKAARKVWEMGCEEVI
jgi:hypothetical protein